MPVAIASFVLWTLLATVPPPGAAPSAADRAEPAWSLDFGPLRGASVTSVWSVGEQLLALDGRNGLTAIDPLSGRVRWFVQLPATPSQPPVAAPLLAVACGTHTLVIDADTGARVFELSSADPAAQAPACDGKRLYTPSLRDGRLIATDVASSRTLWTSLLPARISTPLLLAGTEGGQVLVFGMDDGRLQALPVGATVPQRVLWTLRTGPLVGEPVMRAGRVIAVGAQRAVWSIDATSGRIAWKALPGDAPVTGPLLTSDAVVVGTRGGIVALDLATGAVRWQLQTWDRPVAATDRFLLVTRREGPALRTMAAGTLVETRAPGPEACAAGGRIVESAGGDRLVGWAFDSR